MDLVAPPLARVPSRESALWNLVARATFKQLTRVLPATSIGLLALGIGLLLGYLAAELFTEREVDRVVMVYNHYVSPLTQTVSDSGCATCAPIAACKP